MQQVIEMPPTYNIYCCIGRAQAAGTAHENTLSKRASAHTCLQMPRVSPAILCTVMQPSAAEKCRILLTHRTSAPRSGDFFLNASASIRRSQPAFTRACTTTNHDMQPFGNRHFCASPFCMHQRHSEQHLCPMQASPSAQDRLHQAESDSHEKPGSHARLHACVEPYMQR